MVVTGSDLVKLSSALLLTPGEDQLQHSSDHCSVLLVGLQHKMQMCQTFILKVHTDNNMKTMGGLFCPSVAWCHMTHDSVSVWVPRSLGTSGVQ